MLFRNMVMWGLKLREGLFRKIILKKKKKKKPQCFFKHKCHRQKWLNVSTIELANLDQEDHFKHLITSSVLLLCVKKRQ